MARRKRRLQTSSSPLIPESPVRFISESPAEVNYKAIIARRKRRKASSDILSLSQMQLNEESSSSSDFDQSENDIQCNDPGNFTIVLYTIAYFSSIEGSI